MNPELIIVPQKYNENEMSGSDIALIGLEEEHLEIIDNYFNQWK